MHSSDKEAEALIDLNTTRQSFNSVLSGHYEPTKIMWILMPHEPPELNFTELSWNWLLYKLYYCNFQTSCVIRLLQIESIHVSWSFCNEGFFAGGSRSEGVIEWGSSINS